MPLDSHLPASDWLILSTLYKIAHFSAAEIDCQKSIQCDDLEKIVSVTH